MARHFFQTLIEVQAEAFNPGANHLVFGKISKDVPVWHGNEIAFRGLPFLSPGELEGSITIAMLEV